jgi:hypothetical protein
MDYGLLNKVHQSQFMGGVRRTSETILLGRRSNSDGGEQADLSGLANQNAPSRNNQLVVHIGARETQER